MRQPNKFIFFKNFLWEVNDHFLFFIFSMITALTYCGATNTYVRLSIMLDDNGFEFVYLFFLSELSNFSIQGTDPLRLVNVINFKIDKSSRLWKWKLKINIFIYRFKHTLS